MRVLAVVLVAGALASAAFAASGSQGPHPSLRLSRARPLVVVGSHFRAGERVTVVAHGARAVVVHTRALHGSFTARLGVVPVPRCSSLRIDVLGSQGSRATLTLRRPTCTPPVGT
jgi:hypothetical protein